MKVVAIIQARMGSTRLPGKVLMRVMGKPLFQYQLERLKRSKRIDQIIVASTTNVIDQPIIDLCYQLGIQTFRGSEEDVLERYFEAAKYFKADVIVRLTSDCPLIDPEIMDRIIGNFIDNYPEYHYVSNTIDRTFPRGMDVEVFSYFALEKAFEEGKEEIHREHVTPFIYLNPSRFSINQIKENKDLSQFRWTVDTHEDFLLIEKIIEELYKRKPYFSIHEILRLMETKPDWILINGHIEQKKI